jgi:hypothetical protein
MKRISLVTRKRTLENQWRNEIFVSSTVQNFIVGIRARCVFYSSFIFSFFDRTHIFSLEEQIFHGAEIR